MGGRADGAEGGRVVHANRPEEADRAERAVDEAVGGADEGDVVERRLELAADADEQAARLARRAEQADHRGPLLDRLEQPMARLELGAARLAEQRRRAADEDALLLAPVTLREGGPEHLQERALPWCEPGIVEALPHSAHPQL